MATSFLGNKKNWNRVDRWVAVSDYVAERLLASGVPRGKIFVSKNFLSDPGRLDLGGDGFLVASRLDEDKGIRMLLEAWQRSGLGSVSTLRIAGDGPLRPLVEEAAAAMDGVVYLGILGPQEYREAVQQSAVMVVPSIWAEPFGRAAAEALAFGRPVIASAVGGLKEVVSSDVGWTAKPDAHSFAEVLKEAATGDHVERMNRARARYEAEFSVESRIPRLRALYEFGPPRLFRNGGNSVSNSLAE
jgi:glycosyltransferase involved in cell wall biosynthesis